MNDTNRQWVLASRPEGKPTQEEFELEEGEVPEPGIEGFENAPSAFIGLFEGENVGKQLVEVGEYEG